MDFVMLFSLWDVSLPWGYVLPTSIVGWFAIKFYFLAALYMFCNLVSETDQMLQISWVFAVGFYA